MNFDDRSISAFILLFDFPLDKRGPCGHANGPFRTNNCHARRKYVLWRERHWSSAATYAFHLRWSEHYARNLFFGDINNTEPAALFRTFNWNIKFALQLWAVSAFFMGSGGGGCGERLVKINMTEQIRPSLPKPKLSVFACWLILPSNDLEFVHIELTTFEPSTEKNGPFCAKQQSRISIFSQPFSQMFFFSSSSSTLNIWVGPMFRILKFP